LVRSVKTLCQKCQDFGLDVLGFLVSNLRIVCQKCLDFGSEVSRLFVRSVASFPALLLLLRNKLCSKSERSTSVFSSRSPHGAQHAAMGVCLGPVPQGMENNTVDETSTHTNPKWRLLRPAETKMGATAASDHHIFPGNECVSLWMPKHFSDLRWGWCQLGFLYNRS